MTLDSAFVRGKTYFISLPRRHRRAMQLTQTLVYRDNFEHVDSCPRCVFSIMLNGRTAGEFCIDSERAFRMIHVRPD